MSLHKYSNIAIIQHSKYRFVQNIGVLQPVLQLLLPSVCTRCTCSAFIIFQDVRTRLSEAENQLQLQFNIECWNIPKNTYYIRNPDITNALYPSTVQTMFFRAENPLIKTKPSIQRPMLNVITSLTSFEQSPKYDDHKKSYQPKLQPAMQFFVYKNYWSNENYSANTFSQLAIM